MSGLNGRHVDFSFLHQAFAVNIRDRMERQTFWIRFANEHRTKKKTTEKQNEENRNETHTKHLNEQLEKCKQRTQSK